MINPTYDRNQVLEAKLVNGTYRVVEPSAAGGAQQESHERHGDQGRRRYQDLQKKTLQASPAAQRYEQAAAQAHRIHKKFEEQLEAIQENAAPESRQALKAYAEAKRATNPRQVPVTTFSLTA